MGEECRTDSEIRNRGGGVTCESCCESEDTPVPAMHHGLWQLFPLPGGVSCVLGEDISEEIRLWVIDDNTH